MVINRNFGGVWLGKLTLIGLLDDFVSKTTKSHPLYYTQLRLSSLIPGHEVASRKVHPLNISQKLFSG